MIGLIEQKLAMAGRRAAMGATGVLLVATGAGFLTLALWIVLAEAFGAAIASLIVGAGFIGMGLIVLGVSSSQRKVAPRPDATAADPRRTDMMMATVEAFFVGLTTAMKIRQRR